MSAALLKKSLALCEGIDKHKLNSKKSRKLKARVTKIDKKSEITSEKKISVSEARHLIKSQEEILKNNLQMLKQAKKACKVKLSKDITEQILNRATSRTCKTHKVHVETKQETVFTEEDFKSFEQEFIAE